MNTKLLLKLPLLLLISLTTAHIITATNSLEGGEKDKRRKAKTAVQAAPAHGIHPTEALKDTTLMRTMAIDNTPTPGNAALAKSSAPHQHPIDTASTTTASSAAPSQTAPPQVPSTTSSHTHKEDPRHIEGTLSQIFGLVGLGLMLISFLIPLGFLIGFLMGIAAIPLAGVGLGNGGKDRKRAKVGLVLGIIICSIMILSIVLLILMWRNFSPDISFG